MTVLAERDGYSLDDDPGRVDVDAVRDFLSTAYWSTNIPRELVAKAVEGSLVVGLYAPDGRQVGFARAVTDRATFAWIADVYVLESERGRGLGRFLVRSLLEHPDLQGLRRVMLATADAHELYRSYGFTDLADPSTYLVTQRKPEALYGN